MEIDPMFLAYSYFRRKKFEKCSEICGMILEKSPYDQVFNFLVIKSKVFIVTSGCVDIEN